MTKRISPEFELCLILDRSVAKPLQQQLVDQLRQLIQQRKIEAGSLLPPTRVVAQTLGISRHIVVAAYEDLMAEGYLTAQQGSGTRVSQDVISVSPASNSAQSIPRWMKPLPGVEVLSPDTIDFRLGTVSVSPLPLAVWRRAWRKATSALPPGDYGPASGEFELRNQIAAYLRRVRGMACRPDDVVITSGATAALAAIAQAILQSGDQVGVEEPGYPQANNLFTTYGATLFPMPVDHEGLQVHALPSQDPPLLVHVTPSHQYPIGGRLSIPRRLQLLEWARVYNSLILENDFESEFRYGSMPLPPLASLEAEPEHVVYVGTFSKVLTPALRVGFIVAPPLVRDQILHKKIQTRDRVPYPLQLAVAALIESGDLERHIRRARQQHKVRQQTLIQALSKLPQPVHLRGIDAGLHLLLELDSTRQIESILTIAQSRNVLLEDLSTYYIGTPDRQGLLLSYGQLEPNQIAQGIQRLTDVLM